MVGSPFMIAHLCVISYNVIFILWSSIVIGDVWETPPNLVVQY